MFSFFNISPAIRAVASLQLDSISCILPTNIGQEAERSPPAFVATVCVRHLSFTTLDVLHPQTAIIYSDTGSSAYSTRRYLALELLGQHELVGQSY